jgi:hypothetical protein
MIKHIIKTAKNIIAKNEAKKLLQYFLLNYYSASKKEINTSSIFLAVDHNIFPWNQHSNFYQKFSTQYSI